MPGEMRSNNPTIKTAIPAIMISHQGVAEALAVSVRDEKRILMFILPHTFDVETTVVLLLPL
jgi:hypothetical protein